MKAEEAPEKIYLSDFTDTTEAVFYVKQNNTKKTDIEYTRTDAFIDKACEWIEDNLLTANQLDNGYSNKFRKAMKSYGKIEKCINCQFNFTGYCNGTCILGEEKVEPKFKVGDWCIDNEDGVIFQIVKVLDNTYTYKTNEGKEYSCTHYSLENDAKLWTIQDTKDGDVLAESKGDIILMFRGIGNTKWNDVIDYHCYYKCQKDFIVQKDVEHWGTTENSQLKPATKEQRDLLFNKMKEAGYEWDAEKLELKKIEQKPVDEPSAFKDKLLELFQKFRYIKEGMPTNGDIIDYVDAHIQELIDTIQNKPWSEEDDVAVKDVCDKLNRLSMTYVGNESIVCQEEIKWLKSLKERYTWKPSDEQIKVCKEVYADILSAKGFDLGTVNSEINRLEEQLNKLREE